ncbi:hypothetical protein MTO96_002914 [Rhipicephalus appendiculatus]
MATARRPIASTAAADETVSPSISSAPVGCPSTKAAIDQDATAFLSSLRPTKLLLCHRHGSAADPALLLRSVCSAVTVFFARLMLVCCCERSAFSREVAAPTPRRPPPRTRTPLSNHCAPPSKKKTTTMSNRHTSSCGPPPTSFCEAPDNIAPVPVAPKRAVLWVNRPSENSLGGRWTGLGGSRN